MYNRHTGYSYRSSRSQTHVVYYNEYSDDIVMINVIEECGERLSVMFIEITYFEMNNKK